jgi:thermitase
MANRMWQTTGFKRTRLSILLMIVLLACLFTGGTSNAKPNSNALFQGGSPNDPYYDKLWGLERVGATCAWQYSIGSPEITVAVIDSGVDLTHPDLVNHLRSDGYDFYASDEDPSDENGHGTHVAGIIAAAIDNQEGITGLAPNISILPIRVMDAEGFGPDRAIARGIRYSADQGAQIINLSLGATLTISADAESPQVTSAIRYAQELGSLVIVAAGNDYVPLPNAIVGDNADAMVIAATDKRDRKADFSNSGPWIAVSAPGVNILSTMPTYEVYLTSSDLPRDERMSQNYDYMSGTSQATPMVSALAALIMSVKPEWTAQEVAQAIKQYSVNIDELNTRYIEEPGYLGTGRIDACATLSNIIGGDVVLPTEPTEAPALPEPTQANPQVPTLPDTSPREEPLPAPSQDFSDEELLTVLVVAGGVGLCGLLIFLAMLIMIWRMLRGKGKRQASPQASPQANQRSTVAQTVTPAVTPAPAPTNVANAAWGVITIARGTQQGQRFSLQGTDILIGRDPSCTIRIDGDPTVSRRHASIHNTGQAIVIQDAGSSHGVYINGYRIQSPVILQRGSLIQIGQTILRFE